MLVIERPFPESKHPARSSSAVVAAAMIAKGTMHSPMLCSRLVAASECAPHGEARCLGQGDRESLLLLIAWLLGGDEKALAILRRHRREDDVVNENAIIQLPTWMGSGQCTSL